MRKLAIMGALAAIAWSAPAYATGGMRCAPVQGSGPVLSLGITHGPVAQVFAARLTDGRTEFQSGGFVGGESRRSMIVGQSWIDRQVVWIDLMDAQAQTVIGRLRAGFNRARAGSWPPAPSSGTGAPGRCAAWRLKAPPSADRPDRSFPS